MLRRVKSQAPLEVRGASGEAPYAHGNRGLGLRCAVDLQGLVVGSLLFRGQKVEGQVELA
jgi:hypothetical protein